MAIPLVKRPICYVRRNDPEYRSKFGTRKPPASNGDGRISRIIGSLGKGGFSDVGWRPIARWEEHVETLKRTGHPNEIVDEIIEKHEEYYRNNPPPADPQLRVPEPSPTYTDHVYVHQKVNENGHVSVKVCAPFEKFYSTPLHAMPDLYREAGYSEEFISNVQKKIDSFDERARVASIHLDEVMSRYSGKSTPKPKKSNLRKQFKANKLKSIIVDDDNEEEEGGV